MSLQERCGNLHNLSDPLIIEDANSRLLRAERIGTIEAMADWAREWGEPAILALREAAADQ